MNFTGHSNGNTSAQIHAVSSETVLSAPVCTLSKVQGHTETREDKVHTDSFSCLLGSPALSALNGIKRET